MFKKVIYPVVFVVTMFTNTYAKDVCPGQHHYVHTHTNTFIMSVINAPAPFWSCSDNGYNVTYIVHEPDLVILEGWTDNNSSSSCPKGTKLYGDLCLDKQRANDPDFTEDDLSEEPEVGDAGNDELCVNSYVIPKNREFHEDVDVTGIGFSLHYASSRTTGYINGRGDYVTTDLAHGWTLSNVHHFKAPYLYLGNGGEVKLDPSQYSIDANNETVLYDEDHIGHRFDVNGNIMRSFDAVTGRTLFSFSYNAEGLLLGMTDRFGLTTSVVRDSKGKASSIIAPHGEETKLNIDRNNNLLAVTYGDGSAYSFQYNDGALMTNEIDPVGNSFLHTFDSYGRLGTVTDAVGAVWDFYNTGNDTRALVVTTDPVGEMSRFENYYAVGGLQVSKSTSSSGDVTTVTTTVDELEKRSTICGLSRKLTYGYDAVTAQKRLTSKTITTPGGLTNTINLARNYTDGGTSIARVEDIVNNNGKALTVTKDYTTHTELITSAENRSVTIQFDPTTELPLSLQTSGMEPVQYSYNTEGKLLTKQQGTRTDTYTYDARGNIATYTDAMEQVTQYGYDLLNRLTRVDHPNGYSTLFEYDDDGNMLQLMTPTPADYDFAYNGVNKQTSAISPLGNETQYNYDKKRRLTDILKPSGLGISYVYTNGQLSSMVRPEGTTLFTYGCGSSLASKTAGNESIDYTYDGQLITQMHYAGTLNESIAYTYNSDFLASSVTYAGETEGLVYDNDAMLVQRGSASIVHNAGNGLAESLNDGNYTQNRSYNSYAEMDAVADSIGTNALYGYSIDERNANGQIVQKTEYTGTTQAIYTYGYDEMGHLVSVHKNGALTESYAYNANGNRIGNGIVYTVEDQLEQVGDTVYAYNEDGYLASKITPEGTTHYNYGTLGELKSVVLPNTTIEYLHNADNQRVAKKVNGVITEKYLWADLTTLLAIYDSNDSLVQRFEYADQRIPFAMTYNGNKYYMHYDQVGTLKAVSTEDGTIVKTIEYDTFGNVLLDSNLTLKVPFGFAGGLYDTDTKLTRFGYRDYDAQTGKWTAKDPIGFNGGDTNLYGYVLGDPVNFVDALGLESMFNDANSSIDAMKGVFNPFPIGKFKAFIGFGNKPNKNKSKELFKDAAEAFNYDNEYQKCIDTGLPQQACINQYGERKKAKCEPK